jgi:hypothetical protein
MVNGKANDQLWEGGFTGPVLPPAVPQFDNGAIALAQRSDDQAGVLVSYSNGIFTRQDWTTGHPVPDLIVVLKPPQVRQIRDQAREQLASPDDGLDRLPLRAFVTVADSYLSPEPSARFSRAGFGAITGHAPGDLQGEVTWPDGITGTIHGNEAGVSGESHVPPLPAGSLAPLRAADMLSLIASLEKAVAAGGLDPRWQQMLYFAQQAPR